MPVHVSGKKLTRNWIITCVQTTEKAWKKCVKAHRVAFAEKIISVLLMFTRLVSEWDVWWRDELEHGEMRQAGLQPHNSTVPQTVKSTVGW